jgi:hypothetical protein
LPIFSTVFPGIHHLYEFLSCHLQIIKFLLALLFLLAQSLDLLEAVDELLLRVGHHLPQTLDFICAVI